MFPQRLKALREEKELTQIQLGQKLGFGHSTISQYESGKRKPDVDTLQNLASFFETTTDYLLGRSDIRNYKELEEKMSSGELKVLAAHRSDNPLDHLPPKARKSLEEAIKYIREEENKHQGDKPND